ncbi:MAG: hypothetical protein M1530_02720 [Candidatus Marsarchaeota archaeon]|nr:hypothetical protein [Candidatus Marsarchaeota archaeon]
MAIPRAWPAALMLLLALLPLAWAVSPAADTSYDAWVSISSYSPSSIRLNVSYNYDTLSQSGRSGGAGGQPAGDAYRSELLPLPGARLSLTFDGQPLLDSSGSSACPNLVTSQGGFSGGQALDAGEAICVQPGGFYAASPDPAQAGRPMPISQWPRCALLEVQLVSSQSARIKALHSPPLLVCPANAQTGSLFYLLGWSQITRNPAVMAACLPLVIIMGLLMASMYYRGKDPLSLLDITTPRLPSMRKVRVKPTVQPYHLAAKGRMSDRVIRRTEDSMAATLYALYRRGGKGDPRGQLKKLLPRKNFGFSLLPVRGPSSHADEAALKASMAELQRLVSASGAPEAERQRATEALLRMLQLRETMILEKKVHSWGRAGGRSMTSKLSATIDRVSVNIAKPWMLFSGAKGKPWAEALPGIPYVERTGLVITGWLANRAGNISLRQQLRRTATAEVGVALGLLDRQKSQYAQKHLFDNRKVGNVPFIVEKLRNETYVLGKAVVDEHLRALILASALTREEKAGEVKFKLNQQRLAEIMQMLQDAQKKATDRAGTLNQLEMRRLLAEALLDYANKNLASMRFADAAGQELRTDAEKRAFLEQARLHMLGEGDIRDKNNNSAIAIMLRDGQATKDGLLPIFNTDDTRKMNPDDVFGRYNKMVELLNAYRSTPEQVRNGRIPLVYLGHDLAELAGRAVGAKQLRGELELKHEGQRMLEIRQHMEEELMRRRLFERIIGAPPAGGKLSEAWLRETREALSLQGLRSEMDYSRRGEWAARNFLTGYNANRTGYLWEAERNKIEMIRQKLAYSIGGGQESLLRNYWTQVERNQLIYHTMKELSRFYTGADWNAASYEEWKKRGVLFKDMQKGAWLIGGERSLVPVASNVLRAEDGSIMGVRMRADALGRLIHEAPTKLDSYTDAQGRKVFVHGAFSFLMSDYVDRPVNLTYLYKTPDGKWRPGSPTDRETSILFHQQKAAWGELTSPAYGEGRRDWRGIASAGLMEAAASGRELSREQAWANIRRIEEHLAERVRTIPRSSLATLGGDMAQTGWTRGMARVTQGLERVMRGGAADTEERLHAWYAAQAYARVVILAAQKDIETGKYYSPEVRDSLDAKKKLGELREEQMKLLSKPSLTASEQADLAKLRAQISDLAPRIPELEQRAFKYQQENAFVDRSLKRVADLALPFYNVNESVNMRDPRIAFGGGYAMGQAMMTGYQTGQFVGERPQMWAGYHLFPGDRVLNIFARPNYYASMAFGMHTRTFFTKMTGYTTVYHQDPERGISGANTHEPGVAAGLHSFFRASQSFDWFTRFYAKPISRGWHLKDYQDEFGWKLKEEGNWGGYRYNLPFTFKYGKGAGAYGQGRAGGGGGTDDVSDIDRTRYAQMGLDAGEEMRRRKLGLSFREEYMLWDKREKAQELGVSQQNIDILRERARSVSDPMEKRILSSQVREWEDTLGATRAAWNVPGIRSFFRQGYWVVENRSGYDISAIGGAHRPWEMLSAYHKNVGSAAPVPGMVFVNFEGEWKLFPRLARSIMNPTDTEFTNQYNRGQRTGRDTNPLSNFARLSFGEKEPAGIEQDLVRDALRDTYRRETPVLSKFFDLDMQRQMWSFQNSEYTIPLAPLYLGIYHLFRHNSSWARQQSWNQGTPREKDIGELSEQERSQERAMRLSQAAAQGAGQATYQCPTHGLNIGAGQLCPLCRSSEALRQEREHTGVGPFITRRGESLKNWVAASFSFSEHTDPNYLRYQDQVHCSIHGIGYRRGSACPLCLGDTARRSGGESAEKVHQYQRTLDDYTKRMHDVEFDRSMSEAVKGSRLRDLLQKREEALTRLGIQIDRDTRMGFRQGRSYLQAEMEELKRAEKARNYKLEWV